MKNKNFKIFIISILSFVVNIIMFSKLQKDYTIFMFLSTPDYLKIKFNSDLLTLYQKATMYNYEYFIGFAILFFIILWTGELAYDEYRRLKK